MMTPLLPVRCQLLPDESLASLLMRLQLANHYDANDWAWICRTHSGIRDTWWQPQQPASWEMLAALTGISAKKLYSATFHAYMPALQLPWHDVATTYVARRHRLALTKWARRNYQRRSQATHYCPHCLAAKPYARLSWQVTLTLLCPKHHCLLQTACWRCQKMVTVRQLLLGICSHCKADLTATDPPSVTPEQAQLQSQFTRLLRDPASSLPADWPQQPVPFLFELLRGFTAALPPRQHPPTVQQLLEKQPRAIELFHRWPHNFYDYLDALTPHKSGRVTSDFGILYINWLEKHWRHSELEFVQTAFDDYLVASYPPVFEVTQLGRYKRRASLRDRLPYVSYDMAASMLGISRDLLWLAVRFGVISRYVDKPIIGRSEIQHIQRRWKHGIPLSDVTSLLAIDTFYLDALYSLFSLDITCTTVPLEAFDALALALQPMLHVSHDYTQHATIDYWVMAMDLPLSELLRAILHGHVRAYWVGSDLWNVSLRNEDVLTVFKLSD